VVNSNFEAVSLITRNKIQVFNTHFSSSLSSPKIRLLKQGKRITKTGEIAVLSKLQSKNKIQRELINLTGTTPHKRITFPKRKI